MAFDVELERSAIVFPDVPVHDIEPVSVRFKLAVSLNNAFGSSVSVPEIVGVVPDTVTAPAPDAPFMVTLLKVFDVPIAKVFVPEVVFAITTVEPSALNVLLALPGC